LWLQIVEHLEPNGKFLSEASGWIEQGQARAGTVSVELADAMADHGDNAAWRAALRHDGKVIGDFACYIHCILGLVTR